LKSFDQPFSKGCGSRAEPCRHPQMAKFSFGVSFCELFLCAFYTQRKSGHTTTTYYTTPTAAPLSATFSYTILLQ